MNYQEIIAKCQELNLSEEDYGYGEFDEKVFGKTLEVFRSGGEGKGSDWERVYHFVDHDVYLSMCGYYQSYEGVSFEGQSPTEVRPKQKTITVYE